MKARLEFATRRWGASPALFAWDLSVLARLEAWQAKVGGRVRDWLATIGDVDAMDVMKGVHAMKELTVETGPNAPGDIAK